ncbi:MAG: N-acetyltransferase, partial [Candidatus Brocadiae bacterium]|nr:N-acetyltransferase [Candidatus Brocadiia bacterium]
MSDLTLRPERADDFEAIRDLVRAAFTEVFGAGDGEAGLIDSLRGRPEHDPALALVAERGGEVVGHILFSPVWFVDEPSIRAAVLAPRAVRCDCQRQGIGTRLMEKGLAACRKQGTQAVVVT